MNFNRLLRFAWLPSFVAALGACSKSEEPSAVFECQLEQGAEEPESLPLLGCESDFDSVAAEPTDSSLPGARSVKTIIDRVDGNRLYFQNSEQYRLHYDFASEHLSAKGDLPVIPNQDSFNDNYYSEQRRFYLGAITYYEGPQKWVYEISPYDTADAKMIAEAYDLLSKSTYFGKELLYHPSGQAAEDVAGSLPARVKVITTAELYAGIDYQALNLGKSCGRLVFSTAADLEKRYISYQDIVVLDTVPNDISVAQGIITGDFQTPLSHVNVLSQNRGTPNMGLRGAFDDEELRELDGKWVTLDVGAFNYSIKESSEDDSADCLIQPDPIEIGDPNLSVTTLTDVLDIYDPDAELGMREQISAAVPAFGGKASHYSALARVEEANAPAAFVIPLYFYHQFMEENGFNAQLDELLEDEEFNSDPALRDAKLEELRAEIRLAPISDDLMVPLFEKLASEFPNTRMRFRSSTNAEDLGDFTGAGLYTSMSAEPGDPDRKVEDALREVWSSIWYFRAFEERAYRGIDHRKVGMALLVHRSFPDEAANGVAATSNPFDTSGVEPGFYVNVQVGDESVVQPRAGITTDQYIHYFEQQGKPVVFIENSNLVKDGSHVLTAAQTNQLGVALQSIHQFFAVAYGPKAGSNEWYAMDVEFKFDSVDGEEPQLFVKQARPYPGRK